MDNYLVVHFPSREQWEQGRLGLFTSSEINRLMAKPKSGSEISEGAETYIIEKVLESQGIYEKFPPTFEMQWGIENEGAAAFEFAQAMGLDVTSSEFLYTSDGGTDSQQPSFMLYVWPEISAGTPDIVLLKRKQIVEIKCPKSVTHLRYLMKLKTGEDLQKIKPEYYDQIQHNIMLTNSISGYFVSYDPRLKQNMQLLIIEVKRDDQRIEEIREKLQIANKIKQQILNTY